MSKEIKDLTCEEFFSNCLGIAEETNKIPADAFTNYRIKRGLREPYGTGAMAGVTKIGNVHGYYVYEGEKVADDGKLEYRGYDMSQLIDGYAAENRYGFEEVAYLLLFGQLPNPWQLLVFL